MDAMSNKHVDAALRKKRWMAPFHRLRPLLPKWGPFGLLRYGLHQLERGTLEVGDAAPDAVVVALDGTEVSMLDRLDGKPLVLIFGSFT